MIKTTVSTSEHAMVPVHPGMLVNNLAAVNTMNVAPQINSRHRDILKTLQNRKKCPTTNPMMNPAHQMRDPTTNVPITPKSRIVVSNREIRNPGEN